MESSAVPMAKDLPLQPNKKPNVDAFQGRGCLGLLLSITLYGRFDDIIQDKEHFSDPESHGHRSISRVSACAGELGILCGSPSTWHVTVFAGFHY